ncbi:hypothetical protein K474DRAFT_1178231 [Panus rudis PR-1116 ss-1]|nr:hypothetical protein K474DRAFT_1178231 [Panus rudis PR-1116 ss-1]
MRLWCTLRWQASPKGTAGPIRALEGRCVSHYMYQESSGCRSPPSKILSSPSNNSEYAIANFDHCLSPALQQRSKEATYVPCAVWSFGVFVSFLTLKHHVNTFLALNGYWTSTTHSTALRLSILMQGPNTCSHVLNCNPGRCQR